MSIVTLVSGGLDSTLVAKLAQEEGVRQYPLFIDYGQKAKERELNACRQVMKNLELPDPVVVDLSGYGGVIRSGLTDNTLSVVEDAFTPGRNMLFLLSAASYAYQVGADAVSIGLLHENTSLFPDQTSSFLKKAEELIQCSMGQNIKIIAPLREFYKKDVVELALKKGIKNTYSCHTGDNVPCGCCIACREFKFEEV